MRARQTTSTADKYICVHERLHARKHHVHACSGLNMRMPTACSLPVFSYSHIRIFAYSHIRIFAYSHNRIIANSRTHTSASARMRNTACSSSDTCVRASRNVCELVCGCTRVCVYARMHAYMNPVIDAHTAADAVWQARIHSRTQVHSAAWQCACAHARVVHACIRADTSACGVHAPLHLCPCHREAGHLCIGIIVYARMCGRLYSHPAPTAVCE